MPGHLNENLSEAERLYFKQYVGALDEYSQEIKINQQPLDLTVDLMPPKELFIEVRCQKDFGAVFLPESGEVNL